MKKDITIASWNINSVRLRLRHLPTVLNDTGADIICLQETKVEDSLFPQLDLKAMGFESIAFSGQKSYNGVAILSKIPLENVHCVNYAGKEDCRHISATLPDGTELHNVYIPAGGDIPDPVENEKFDHKLRFVDDLTAWSKASMQNRPAIIVGDFNIAPLEHDVWSHKQLLSVVSHTPIEVEKLTAMQRAADWQDALRLTTPEPEKLYSWWSYRARDWEKSNRGRRLDHIWHTRQLQDAFANANIAAHARRWEQPSDHVPIFATYKLAA